MTTKQHRRLDTWDDDSEWIDRHFERPFEENVFDQQDTGNEPASSPPSSSPSSPDPDTTDPKDGKNSTGNDPDGDDGNDSDYSSSTQQPTDAPSTSANVRDPLPLCQVDSNGNFFVSTQARENFADNVQTVPTVVSFAYQVQGSLELNVQLLQSVVLPALERDLAAKLVPELFAPQSCVVSPVQTEMDHQSQPSVSESSVETKDASSSATTPSMNAGGIRRQLSNSLNEGPPDSPVTGLQPTPKDRLLPNYEGVRCRTQLVEEASRCFILTGAFSLSGPVDVDWAIPSAQRATERVMNEQRALDSAHPLVQHVLYLDDLDADSDIHNNSPPPTSPETNDSNPQDRISTAWSWVVVGAAAATLVVAVAWWRRFRTRRGSYNERRGCCSRTMGRGSLTREYQSYPSPDRSVSTRPSPRRSTWAADNAVAPSTAVFDSWSESNAVFSEKPELSFDPVLAPSLVSLGHSTINNENDDPHDGSFPSNMQPSYGHSILHDDDESTAVPFYDDDDDAPAHPSSSWLRDLV